MTSVEKITQIIKDKGIAPTKMMRDLGFSSGLFTQWKQGKQKPSLSKLSKIAEYLGVPLFAITDSEFSFNPEDMISLSDIPDPDEGRTCYIEEEPKEKSVDDLNLAYTIEMLKKMSPEDVLKAKKIIEALQGY